MTAMRTIPTAAGPEYLIEGPIRAAVGSEYLMMTAHEDTR